MEAFDRIPLSPVAFLDRARAIHADRTAWVDPDRRLTYLQLADRSEQLAGALMGLGVRPGDTVSVLAPNVLVMLEAHFAVPLAGGVLNALNTRLTALELAYIVGHADATVLLVDHELSGLGSQIQTLVPGIRRIVVGGPDDEYESLISSARADRVASIDELSLLALNYTSGTTGRPKGVMYSHRGAYLQSLAMAAQAGIGCDSKFLWTLPMFHCNGWCFPWALTAAGGAHVGLRKVDPDVVWQVTQREAVTHFNAAPTVLTALVDSPLSPSEPLKRPVRVATGGAPPSPRLLADLAAINIEVTHLYGLTETYGPAMICEWREEWHDRVPAARARLRARQGVPNLVGEPVRVIGPEGRDVPADGNTIGEVLLRGHNVMIGYFKDPEGTAAANHKGWLRTGDLGVLHPDGYLELRDRAKDVIISGGENIASIEVEQALASHEAVLECAVVAAPDAFWGEVPVAFVELRKGATCFEADLVDHVKARLARFKVPKRIEFRTLPRTSTGKIQKFLLRDEIRSSPESPPAVER